MSVGVGPLVSSVIPIAFSAPGHTVTITATSSPGTTIGTVTMPPLPVSAIFVAFTDVSFVNTSTSAVNVAVQIQTTGFGTSTITATIGATTTGGFNENIPASSATLLDTIWWYLPNGGAGVQFNNVGGTISLLAFASTASVVNASNNYIIVYGHFGGTV